MGKHPAYTPAPVRVASCLVGLLTAVHEIFRDMPAHDHTCYATTSSKAGFPGRISAWRAKESILHHPRRQEGGGGYHRLRHQRRHPSNHRGGVTSLSARAGSTPRPRTALLRLRGGMQRLDTAVLILKSFRPSCRASKPRISKTRLFCKRRCKRARVRPCVRVCLRPCGRASVLASSTFKRASRTASAMSWMLGAGEAAV